MKKRQAFVSYRFRMVEEYAGLLDMFERQGLALVNRSVDPRNASSLPREELISSLDMRIRTATHVIVLISRDLAESSCCKLEIEIARQYGKPIIGVYPNGEFGGPIPTILDGGLYRAVGWRGNALERAIRGEYPVESRVFDLSEEADRREGVALLGTLAAGTTVLFGVQLESEVRELREELRSAGIPVPEPEPPNTAKWIIEGAVGGLVVTALLGGRRKRDFLAGAAIGGTLGYGLGRGAHARAELRRLGPLVEIHRRGLAQDGRPTHTQPRPYRSSLRRAA